MITAAAVGKARFFCIVMVGSSILLLCCMFSLGLTVVRLLLALLLLAFLLLFCDAADESAPAEEVLGIVTDDRTWGNPFFFFVPFSAVRLANSSTC